MRRASAGIATRSAKRPRRREGNYSAVVKLFAAERLFK